MYHGRPYFFNYDNYREQPHNTCGQAVIATLLDHSGKNPYQIEKQLIEGEHHFEHHQILKEVMRDFGPNWPLRNMVTVRRQIKRALEHYDIPFRETTHKPFQAPAKSREALEAHLDLNQPVVILIDTYSLKIGSPFTLHWLIAYGYDDEHIWLATWGKSMKLSWADFMRAWRCWFMTYPYNYYQLQVTL